MLRAEGSPRAGGSEGLGGSRGNPEGVRNRRSRGTLAPKKPSPGRSESGDVGRPGGSRAGRRSGPGDRVPGLRRGPPAPSPAAPPRAAARAPAAACCAVDGDPGLSAAARPSEGAARAPGREPGRAEDARRAAAMPSAARAPSPRRFRGEINGPAAAVTGPAQWVGRVPRAPPLGAQRLRQRQAGSLGSRSRQYLLQATPCHHFPRLQNGGQRALQGLAEL